MEIKITSKTGATADVGADASPDDDEGDGNSFICSENWMRRSVNSFEEGESRPMQTERACSALGDPGSGSSSTRVDEQREKRRKSKT